MLFNGVIFVFVIIGGVFQVFKSFDEILYLYGFIVVYFLIFFIRMNILGGIYLFEDDIFESFDDNDDFDDDDDDEILFEVFSDDDLEIDI